MMRWCSSIFSQILTNLLDDSFNYSNWNEFVSLFSKCTAPLRHGRKALSAQRTRVAVPMWKLKRAKTLLKDHRYAFLQQKMEKKLYKRNYNLIQWCHGGKAFQKDFSLITGFDENFASVSFNLNWVEGRMSGKMLLRIKLNEFWSFALKM